MLRCRPSLQFAFLHGYWPVLRHRSFLQFVFGILGGIGPEVDNLIFMKRTADGLFGDDYRWSVLGAGAAQMPLATTGSQMGGHVRVWP